MNSNPMICLLDLNDIDWNR